MIKTWDTSVKKNTFPSILSKECKIISIDIGIKNFAIRIENLTPKEDQFSHQLVFFDKVNLTSENVYNSMIHYLDSKFDYIKDTNIVIIERQLSRNQKCSSLMMCVIFYFIMKKSILNKKYAIADVSSKLKSLVLKPNGEKISGLKLKKKSIEIATKILEERKDIESLVLLENCEKKDDLCDTIVQLVAFCISVRKK